jgi:hypothetical protein
VLLGECPEPELDVALGPRWRSGPARAAEAARIDGRVAGTVMAGASVWVGATGVVEADLEADTIVVEGKRARRSARAHARSSSGRARW